MCLLALHTEHPRTTAQSSESRSACVSRSSSLLQARAIVCSDICLDKIIFNLFFCFSTISSILGAWLDQYSEDFWTPPNHECLHQLLSYLHLHFPGSDLERRARNLLAHFQRRQQCEPDSDGMQAGQGLYVGGPEKVH